MKAYAALSHAPAAPCVDDVHGKAYKNIFWNGIDEVIQAKTRNLLSVPVFGSDGGVIGVLQIMNKLPDSKSNKFTEDDQKDAQEIATFLGFEIEGHMGLKRICAVLDRRKWNTDCQDRIKGLVDDYLVGQR